MSAPLSPEQRAAMTAALARTEPATGEHVRQALSDALSIRGHSHQPLVVERLRRVEARVPAIVRRLLDAEAEVERLRASAVGAHRRIDAVLDHLATLDAVQLSEDAGALGFHIVAVLDSPVHADEEVPARPALPWAAFLEDVEVSGLVEELASVFLDYWRGERAADVSTLREVERLLVKHRDGSQVAAELDARVEAQFAAEAGHGAPDGGVS